MAIKLDALTSWKFVPAGEQLLLPSDSEDQRRIRIDLNCEDKTWLYVSYVDLEVVKAQFLAAVGPGLETVEFYAQGDIAVSFATAADDGQPSQVWLYTAELEPNVAEVPDAQSFTEIHQRRARNPELEMMQLIARQNERRMDEQMAHLAALIAKQKEVSDVDAGTSVGAAGSAGEAANGGGQPASGEVAAGGGEPAGGAGGDGDES